MYYQGDIIKAEGIKYPLLVVSKDIYNKSEKILACAIVDDAAPSPIYYKIKFDDSYKIVLCDQIKLIDLNSRASKRIGQIELYQRVTISDIIQGLFEY